MSIWIVMRNGEVDEVFDSAEAAAHHALQLSRKWSRTSIFQREVKSL
ncbi:hypothetical protein [Sinorhizobium meliloti]|nr:hypothetical protein [Sinorhizobium meliloti]